MAAIPPRARLGATAAGCERRQAPGRGREGCASPTAACPGAASDGERHPSDRTGKEPAMRRLSIPGAGTLLLGLVALVLLFWSSALVVAQTVVATIPVGSQPFGVAVNPTTNRVYVANMSSNNVSVIDAATNMVVATVPVSSTPRGVAANSATNRIYVTQPTTGIVSV